MANNAANALRKELLRIRVDLVPYYLQSVQAGSTALSLAKNHDPLERIEILMDGAASPIHSTVLTAYTQTASSMGSPRASLRVNDSPT